MRLLVLLAVAGLLLAGCSGDAPSSTTTARTTGGAGTTSGASGPEAAGATFLVVLDGALDVGVPLPHLDRCVAPQDWAAGEATTGNATWRLLTVNRGTLLQVTTTGTGFVQLELDLAEKPKCQTLRHDPWSIDPDPADGTVEVQAGQGSANLVVIVHVREGPCATVAAYNGTVATPGWNTLTSRSGTSSSCT